MREIEAVDGHFSVQHLAQRRQDSWDAVAISWGGKQCHAKPFGLVAQGKTLVINTLRSPAPGLA